MSNIKLINDLLSFYGIEIVKDGILLNIKSLENGEVISRLPITFDYKGSFNYNGYNIITNSLDEIELFKISLYKDSLIEPELSINYSFDNSILNIQFKNLRLFLTSYLHSDEMLNENTLAILYLENIAIVQGYEIARIIGNDGLETEISDVKIFEIIHSHLDSFIEKDKKESNKDYTNIYYTLYNLGDNMVKDFIDVKSSVIVSKKKNK